MNRLQKIHYLKVIKEAMSHQFNIVWIETINGKEVYLTDDSRLEIPENIRLVFFKGAIIFESVSKHFKPKNWIKIPD